ncbi:Bug family tripartite tricarboxylate transporter substrate binding protein [Elioraea sp.]|uniref:Bug family tripartite tricarboxylate transporter substrate binding protein n=1 Tax=Elioraea sp. TaxID=2185103 RepID=UPI003F723E1D
MTGPSFPRRSLLSAASAALATPAVAQAYPSRPVTILVPFAAGGATDVTTRVIADFASEKLGQRVLVENRPGAGGGLMTLQLARATPDGYTLGALTASPVLVRPHAVADAGYDPTRDLTFIARYLLAPQPIAVATNSPWRTYQDLIAWARANPGRLRYTAIAARGGAHVVIEMAFRQEGVRAVHVPFNSGPEAITAFRGRHIDMVAQSDYAVLFDAGEIRILAETGPERLPVAPEAPTFRELGYPVSPAIFYGIGGPANLPPAIVERWETLVREATEAQRMRDLIARLKMIPSFASGETFRADALRDFVAIGEALRQMP